MASGSKEPGQLYVLCLPRATVRELYEHHLRDHLSGSVEATYRLFGAEPYTFGDERHWDEPAALREFGVLRTSKAKRQRVYNSLPSSYQKIIDRSRRVGVPFGPLTDAQGRYYKYETATAMTVLLPKGKRHDLTFPLPGELVTIWFVDEPSGSRTIVVNYMGISRGNTCVISWKQE